MSNGLTILDGGMASATIDKEQTQINAGRRLATDTPEEWKSQSWQGYYRDPTRENIHVLLHNMYYGIGGFAGDIPTNDLDGQEQATNSIDAYSYIHAKKGERYYRTRVKDSPLYNFFARIVDSQIVPIFSANRLTTVTKRGESTIDDPQMVQFMKNCTGTGTQYISMQEFLLRELIVHDVAFYAVIKRKNRDIPVITAYQSIDHITSTSDENGELNRIVFSTGLELIDKKEFQTAIVYEMQNGYCWIMHMIARNDKNKSLIELKWEEDTRYKPFNTEIDRMVVRAQLPEATATGEWLPVLPKMRRFSNICMDIWQFDSKVSYLATLCNLPLLNTYGDVSGVNIGQGNAMNSVEGATGYAPLPAYVSPDSSLLSADIEYLKYKIDSLRDIAKENGVDSVQSNSAQSGDSKRFDFQATEQKLQNSIALLEDMDQWVFMMFDIYLNRGEGVNSYVRAYPESFYPEEVATLADMETVFLTAKEAGASKSALMVLKSMVLSVLGKGATDADVEIISEEIDGIVLEKEQVIE